MLYQTDEIIGRLIAWAEKQTTVRAMLLTSTRAVSGAPVDAFSDYDVILAAADIHPFHEDRSWLEDFGQVLVAYWDPIYPVPDYGIEIFGNVTQYEDGLKIDFTLWPVELLRRIVEAPTLPAELDAGYLVLLDKDGLTAGLQTPTYAGYIPTPPSNETYQTHVNDFFSDAPYVAKCLRRHELLPAKWCLDYDMKHVYLRPMLEWRIQLDNNWSAKIGALGKGLKKHLPPDLWAQLESAYAGAGIEENWQALLNTIAIFRRVAVEVADHLGYEYPYDLDQRITAYLQKVYQEV
jgi:aminoglycoside 6-adenylyltransferase